jgi:hypothetical protein
VEQLDAGRFSGISGAQSGDLAHLVPGLSRSESKASEFLHSKRARMRARYAAPQSVGMFAINGSTTTLVKDESAPRGTIIGADVIPIFI